MIRLVIIVCLLAVLTVFALSNPAPSEMWIISKSFHISIGLLAFGLSIFFLLIGLVIGWAGELKQRHRARRAETQSSTYEKQIADLQQQVSSLHVPAAEPTGKADVPVTPSPVMQSPAP
ncbi:LapA family protein [Acetobacteraceae bacterium ESL0709]|nr:LapA family protein [Acetobacteraceae bacterium ESL0697]MDF7678010.1 LapA family protein [Acetobacteraceae bacterium ESL0709]